MENTSKQNIDDTTNTNTTETEDDTTVSESGQISGSKRGWFS